MKRKFSDQDYSDVKQICEESTFMGNLYGYKVTKIKNEIIFDLRNTEIIQTKENNQHILIYDISAYLTEDKLLPFLFKIAKFRKIRCIKINKKLYFLATLLNDIDVTKVRVLLGNYETLDGYKISASICREIYKIYIANIKVQQIGFYTIQNRLLSLLTGLQKITFYAVDKYKRYCVVLEFFESCDTELGLKLLSNDYLFQCNPEVIVTESYKVNFRSEPAVIFEWSKPSDSQNVKPSITILDRLEARNLQNY